MTGVIHVITALERGGAQRNTLETAARLHDEGRPQLLVTGRPAALDDEAARRLGTRFVHLPDLVAEIDPLKDAAAAFALARLIDRTVDRLGSPLVVHTHSSKAGVVGRLAARAIRGVHVVHTVHGFGLDALGSRKRSLLEAAERVSGRACDVAVFVAESDRDRAHELRLFPHARDVVIRSGIDPKPFAALKGDTARRESARARFGLALDDVVAVTVGNLKPQKDPLFHVEILHAWHAHDARRKLLFLGDGPLRNEVEQRARDRGVTNALVLPGFVDDTVDALAAADVFLLASAWEGLPRAVLEAIAAGLPCVVRDTGYASDLAWAKSVRALPLDAPARAFADALDAALSSRKRASSKLPREFTLDGMLDGLRELYDDLIGPPRPTMREPSRRAGRRSASKAGRRR